MRQLTLDDGVLGGALILSVQPPQPLTARPHQTVSQSEAGFEKVMQAAELVLVWLLEGKAVELSVTLEVQPRRA
jgi:hypothetical protein